jgi:hypothetical protein
VSRQLDYWTVLGLDEPPKDRKSLKRAYAKRLKETRPEDDPEGFMLLRDAHDIGLRDIAYQQSLHDQDELAPIETHSEARIEIETTKVDDATKTESIVTSDIPQDILDTDSLKTEEDFDPVEITSELDDEPTNIETLHDPNLGAPKFPLQVELTDLLDHPEKRYKRDNWAHIFRQANDLDIDEFSDFENGLLHLLLERSGFYTNPYGEEETKPVTSQSIAASIFATLKWDEAQTANSYKAEGIAWLKRKLIKPQYAVSHDGVTVPETPNNFWSANLWWVVGLVILFVQLARFITSQS